MWNKQEQPKPEFDRDEYRDRQLWKFTPPTPHVVESVTVDVSFTKSFKNNCTLQIDCGTPENAKKALTTIASKFAKEGWDKANMLRVKKMVEVMHGIGEKTFTEQEAIAYLEATALDKPVFFYLDGFDRDRKPKEIYTCMQVRGNELVIDSDSEPLNFDFMTKPIMQELATKLDPGLENLSKQLEAMPNKEDNKKQNYGDSQKLFTSQKADKKREDPSPDAAPEKGLH